MQPLLNAATTAPADWHKSGNFGLNEHGKIRREGGYWWQWGGPAPVCAETVN